MQPLLSSEPTSIGSYRLLNRLGKGAMGTVYLGRSRSGRMVAVKVVRPELADDAEFRERFRREVEMARAVGGFWTAAVVDADPDAEQPWLAAEYVPGPTLHKAVSEHGPLPEQTVRTLAAGLAEALDAIHRADLVHRDLKPANVLLGPDGPRVIDFGISRAVTSSSMTSTGTFMGTPGFFSPEQTVGDEVGPPSDVFSLGAVLAFAATGKGPFGNESIPIMLYRVVHVEADLTRVPETLRPLLTACLNKNPTERPTTSEILDQVGEPIQEGSRWLPPAIKAAIDEHTTRLRLSDVMPEPTPTPPPGMPPAGATPPRPSAPLPVPPPSAGEQTDKILPAPARYTGSQPITPPTVGENTPGPVFSTGRRLPALTTAVVLLGLVRAAFNVPYHVGFPVRYWNLLQIAVLLLELGLVVSLIRAAVPTLRLKINSTGIRISRLGFSREILWHQVSRIGIVGRGRKQAVAIWVPDSVTRPESRWWHRANPYHGGTCIFPLGAIRGRRKRQHEISRVRLALEQYAGRLYDGRLL